jgi:ubiquinone/menaquinone biosynthesis C-methylase UbiE
VEKGPSGGSDRATVDGFGFEWSTYDQTERDESSLRATFDRYMSLLPWSELPAGARGVDIGCGSGRWSRLARERGVEVIGVDASRDSLRVARSSHAAPGLLQASASALPLRSGALDFGFSLGVLHHLANPDAALREAHRVLRPRAPLLVYMYYALENRPRWFRALWRASDAGRRTIARLPRRARLRVTRLIARFVYLPLARTARVLELFGLRVDALPLAAYRNQPLYVMQTDALDRFGTLVEHRFTRSEIHAMLSAAGFTDVTFRERWPYWCAVGRA